MVCICTDEPLDEDNYTRILTDLYVYSSLIETTILTCYAQLITAYVLHYIMCEPFPLYSLCPADVTYLFGFAVAYFTYLLFSAWLESSPRRQDHSLIKFSHRSGLDAQQRVSLPLLFHSWLTGVGQKAR